MDGGLDTTNYKRGRLAVCLHKCTDKKGAYHVVVFIDKRHFFPRHRRFMAMSLVDDQVAVLEDRLGRHDLMVHTDATRLDCEFLCCQHTG